jgi:hypothetical protein
VLEALEEAGCEWVVRLNTKSGVKITEEFEGEEIPLAMIGKGEKREIQGVYYRGAGEGKRGRYLAEGPKRAVVGDG